MSWAQRLARVFAIDIEHCLRCGGRLKVIASIEAPALIERILAQHLLHAVPPAGVKVPDYDGQPYQRTMSVDD